MRFSVLCIYSLSTMLESYIHVLQRGKTKSILPDVQLLYRTLPQMKKPLDFPFDYYQRRTFFRINPSIYVGFVLIQVSVIKDLCIQFSKIHFLLMHGSRTYSLDLCSFLSFFDQTRISTNFALKILAEIFHNSILVNLLFYPKKTILCSYYRSSLSRLLILYIKNKVDCNIIFHIFLMII